MKMTDKDKDIFDDLVEFFTAGETTCIACMVEKYWKISQEDEKYPYYVAKQRGIVGKVVKHIMHMNPEGLPTAAFNGLRRSDRLYLMAVDVCEDHPSYRRYRILNSLYDHQVIGTLTAMRIEGMVNAQNNRTKTAVKLFPGARRMMKFIKGDVSYLPKPETHEKDTNRRNQ